MIAAQEQYRIEAGTKFTGIAVIHVEVRSDVIIDAPPGYDRWVGQELHRLEWWLTAKYGTSQTRRVGV